MKSLLRVTAATALAVATLVPGATRATIVTWNGASSVPTTNWTDAGNWVGGVAPVSGDALVFDGATATTNVNDFAAGTNFAGITWAATGGTFLQSGSSINLSGNLVNARVSGTTTTTTPFVLQQNVNVDVATGGTLNLNGAISGGFAVTKIGGGLAAAGVALTNSGGLNVNGGTFRTTLAGNTTSILGTGTISIDNNAVLELRATGSTTFNNALVVGAGGARIDERSNHIFSPASISGNGPLTLRPTGADNLVFTLTDMKGWAGDLIADRNGRLNYGLRMASAYLNNSMVNVALTLNDATFLTRQNGTNTTTFVTDLGSLSSASSNTSIGGSAAGSGYFTFSIGSLNTSTSFAGNMIDGGTRTALRKVGNGDLTLGGTANTFSGPSTVESGRLLVSGTLTNANLTLAVNGGTLGGNGSIAGAVTVNGGMIAPGASAGTLTLGSLIVNSTGILTFELNGADQTVGSNVNDLLVINGNLTLDGTLNVAETIANSFLSAASGNSWRLINYTGTLTDNVLDLGSLPLLSSGLFYTIDTATAGQVNLVVNAAAVPEAGAALFLAVAASISSAGFYAKRRGARHPV